MNIYRDYRFQRKDMFYKHQITLKENCDYYSKHTHNMYELLYFIEGDAILVIEDKRYVLKSGDLALIRPMKYHYIQISSSADYERYDILFDERNTGIINTDLIDEEIEVININDDEIAAGIFKKLDIYFSRLSDESFYDILKMQIMELFYDLSITYEKSARKISSADPILSRALKYINDNLFTLQSIGEISEQVFVTDSYLYRLFKKEMKKSPKKYINDKRLLAAQSLIQMGDKPTEVCERCGFSDYTSFYRNYKEYFGYPPSKEEQYTAY